MRTIFLSYGFEDEGKPNRYPEIDRVDMQMVINNIAAMAVRYNYTIVMRDHPAVTPIMQIHFENAPDRLKVAKEHSDLEKILSATKPQTAFLVGGGTQVADDAAQILADHPQIALLPLPSTGGAAQFVAEQLLASGSAHPLLRDFGYAVFGLKMISKAMPSEPVTPKPFRPH